MERETPCAGQGQLGLRLGLALLGLVLLGLLRLGLIVLGLVLLGLGLIMLGLVLLGLIVLGLIVLGLILQMYCCSLPSARQHYSCLLQTTVEETTALQPILVETGCPQHSCRRQKSQHCSRRQHWYHSCGTQVAQHH